MDLRTEYLGFTLPHPLVAGASPLADDLDSVRRLEDAGAAAIVLRSLFEEQITREQMSEYVNLDATGSRSRGASYFPSPTPSHWAPSSTSSTCDARRGRSAFRSSRRSTVRRRGAGSITPA